MDMNLESYMRFLLALIFVLALIGVMTALARRYGLGINVQPSRRGNRRLSVVEVMPIDAKRRAVLIRRDGVEHLVLLGAASETVIERGIAPPSFSDALGGARLPPSEDPA